MTLRAAIEQALRENRDITHAESSGPCVRIGAAVMKELLDERDAAIKRADEAHKEEREACAQLAEQYADVNREMAGDTILLDPVLRGKAKTEADFKRSEDLMIEGAMASSSFHTAQYIANAIRTRGGEVG